MACVEEMATATRSQARCSPTVFSVGPYVLCSAQCGSAAETLVVAFHESASPPANTCRRLRQQLLLLADAPGADNTTLC